MRADRETLFLLLNTQMGSYPLSRWTIHVSLYRHVSWKDHLSIIFHVSTRRSRVSLCRIKEKAIRQADKKGIVREGIFVNTITYCFCSNRTIVYCVNKEWENSSMKWMISNESLNYTVCFESHSNSTIHLKSFISSMSSLILY